MNLKTLKLIFNILFLFVLLALALPEFSFKVAGEEIRYPGIGFSRIGIPEDFGSFRKGKDMFPTDIYRSRVETSADEENPEQRLREIAGVIQKRIDYAGLSFINLDTQITNNEYFLTFEFPAEFEDAAQYVAWISARGEISFSSTASGTIEGIADQDIESPITIRYVSDASQALQLNIDEEKSVELLAAFNNVTVDEEGNQQTPNITLNVDGTLAFFLIPSQSVESGQNTGATTVNDYTTLIAQSLFVGEGNLTNHLNIVRSYFVDEVIEESINPDTEVYASIAPDFNPEGGQFLAITFILSAMAIGIYILRRSDYKGAIAFGILLSFNLLLLVNLLKVVGAYISFGTVVGFVVVYLLAIIMIMDTLFSDIIGIGFRKGEYSDGIPQDKTRPGLTGRLEEMDVNKLSMYRNLGILLFIISAAVFRVVPNLGQFTDTIGVFIAFGITTIFVNVVNYRFFIVKNS